MVARSVRRILVTDADQRAAVAVVRSLGRAGYVVIVGTQSAAASAAVSRYCSGRVLLPDPLRFPTKFASAVAEAVRANSLDAVVPVSEQALLALLPERERLSHVVIPFPDLETFKLVSDKREVLSVARRIGIRVPRQVSVESRDDVPRGLHDLSFPVVLKPSRSVGSTQEAYEKHGVSYSDTPEDLCAKIKQTPESGFPLLLQEKIEGPGIGVFLLRWEGQTLAVFAHKRLREKPPSGGVSTYAESTVADPELVSVSERLLDAFGWNGVAMVEYKQDAATGQPVLMEINGRFWGTLQLAIDSGVDFPHLLLQAAAGHRPPLPQPRRGVRYRWLLGDLDALIKVLTTPRANLNVPTSFPSRSHYARQFTQRAPAERWDMFDVRDPLPFVLECSRWLSGYLRVILLLSKRLLWKSH
jgi:predicted ATP-grasp superfamily ATP-dependent carboligase